MTLPLIQDCVLIALETVGFEVTGGAVLAGNLTDADTSILVNADSIVYVLADQSVTYDVSSGGLVEPLYSDRAVWDALAYSARHANDIDDAAGIHHTLGGLNGLYISKTLPDGNLLVGNGSNIATPVSLSGDATIDNAGALTLATVNSNVGTFGDATHVGQVTFDAKGRAIAARNIPIISRAILNMLQAAAGGVTRSGSTTDNHLAVWNGADADSIKDGGAIPAGVTGDFLVMQVFS